VRFVKQLQLQGYKTFASRTVFVFDEGITAIVGPNGSGKSNIADGLRWVLGEQSYSVLRGKRTEDMIFSGSDQRPRLGMAHVALTFDNSTGWLPVEFSEVEIARRAYRSGENEYYINGNRVRLRDVLELLGSSGLAERTYTVIGQGLVDQALSQRPEERRKLFEEAAGITVHQRKREEALQRLADARVNLTRAQDIIAELTPRLRYLKGQVRRATEYQQLKTDLDALLRTWYGYQWYQALQVLSLARDQLAEHTAVTEELAGALNTLLEQSASRRSEGASLREQLSVWHRASSELHRRAEVVQRELAVRSEQHRLWGEQREELERELVHLRALLEDGEARLQAAARELAEAQRVHQTHHSLVAAAQQELDEREEQRRLQAERLNQAQEAALALKTQLAANRSRLAQLGERQAELLAARQTQDQAVQEAAAEVASLAEQMARLSEQVAACQAELARLEEQGRCQAQELAAAQEAEQKANEELMAAQRLLARLQDQYELLTRLREEGAGLSAGPRAVLAARRELQGIIGALGDLIEVPAELERAIEAALGSRLQDIVVQRWEDAEAAVAFLKKRQAGRATFLPLDTLRPGQPATVPHMADVIGLASKLVKCNEAVRPAVELALNRTLVVRDLPTARRLLSEGGWAALVTLEGEIVRPGGSVTGGSDNQRRDSGLLARGRALRELPAQMRAAEARLAACQADVSAAREREAAIIAAINALHSQRDELATRQTQLANERNHVQLAWERARQAQAWHAERLRQSEQEIAELEARRLELQATISKLAEQLVGQEAAVEAAHRALAALATDELVANLARLRAEAAVSAGQLQSHQARVAELANQQQARQQEIATKEERVRMLAAQQAEAAQAMAELAGTAQALAAELAALMAKIEPAEARLAALDNEQRDQETQEHNLREQLRLAQMRQNQAELAVQRGRDKLSHLRNDIEKELGLVVLSEADGWEASEVLDSQIPLPLNGMVVRLPKVTELPEGLEDDVRHLRQQISRLGPVNLDAIKEYNELEARYNFLTSQAEDLQKAVTSLEEVIAELDRVMEREFLATFKAVAAQFREEFVSLFGGGSARLVLTEPDSPSTTGVEIIARPPGKREQGLALLSGGERALTAAALIFSILKARPTPFCVLDEVDAALDEANIGRFRDALKALSKQTQFVIITHNRGTIEVADTIYGVSMGPDNTSQVLSLKLQGNRVVPVSAGELGT